MSTHKHINKLDKATQNKIYCALIENGCDKETIDYIMVYGKLSDISEYVDMGDL